MLKIHKMTWHNPGDKKYSTPPKIRALYPKDGFIVYYKDKNEPQKELSEEEKKYLKDKEIKLRSSNSMRFKEKSLHIKQEDIDIDIETNVNIKN